VEHAPTTFRLKNKIYIVQILKHPHGPLNYTTYLCKLHIHVNFTVAILANIQTQVAAMPGLISLGVAVMHGCHTQTKLF